MSVLLKVSTDCSGIDAPIHALNRMNIPFKHVWSCEIEKKILPLLHLNTNSEIFYDDMITRNYDTLPKTNIYITGFPCQPYSIANGQRKELISGSKVHDKANIFDYCIKTILSSNPEIFILENVKGLIMGKMKDTFNVMCKELKDLEKYNIYWKLLSTKDYGIPQSRPRVYIIGIQKDVMKTEFKFPEPIPLNTTFRDYLNKNDNNSHKTINDLAKLRIQNTNATDHIIDYHYLTHKNLAFYSNSRFKTDIIPCITKSTDFYYTKEERFLSGRELLNLQGFDETFQIPDNFSDRIVKQAAGNSMSINILQSIFKEIFNCIDISKLK